MNICPHCGADILDMARAERCSSCGSDLEAAVAERAHHHAYKSEDTEKASNALGDDDTAPIKPADDLDVVQSGEAFWANASESAAPNSETEPTLTGETKAEDTQIEAQADKARANRIFESKVSVATAPSLADLAARRALQETGESEPADPTSHFDSRMKTPEAACTRKPTTYGLDDTQPEVNLDRDWLPNTGGPHAPGITVVTKTPDFAFIDGHQLYIPGVAWIPGESVVMNGHTYQLKRKAHKYPISPKQATFALGGLVAGCLIAWLALTGDPTPQSGIFGVARDSQNGELLPGVTIAIEDENRTVQTDLAGMFHFGELKGGIYTLVASDPIYGKSRKSVTVSGDASTVLLELQRPTEEIALITPPQKPPSPQVSTSGQERTTPQSGSATKRGQLAVTASVPNAEIYLDGKLLAVGNGVYSEIRPGKRKIRVVHSGFEPWEKQVTISRGETSRIEPELIATQAPEPVAVPPEQYAAAGRKHLEARQYELAMQQLSLAIEGASQPQFYAWRADAYVGMRKMQAAEADFLSAVNLFGRANQDSRLDDLLSHAILVVPGSPVLRLAYADYLYRHRRLKDAEKHYRRGLELGGNPVEAYTGIGLAQYAGGSFEGAMKSWEEADNATGHSDPHLAGYLALVNARLQYRASCRNAVRRLEAHPQVLEEFRGHPDWQRVRHLTGGG